MKRMLCWLLSLLCLFCAHAEKAESPAVCRALLVGCDVFLTHEDTSPSAALNVERMDRMLRTDARGYAKITRRDAGLADGAALQAALEEAFAGADENDVSFIYLCTHGLYDRVSLEPLLVLSDGQSENSLSAAALRELLDRVPGQKILVIDACNRPSSAGACGTGKTPFPAGIIACSPARGAMKTASFGGTGSRTAAVILPRSSARACGAGILISTRTAR